MCFIGFFLFIYYVKTSTLFGDPVPSEDSNNMTEETITDNPYDNQLPPTKKDFWMSPLCILKVISVYRYFICSIIVNSMQISPVTYAFLMAEFKNLLSFSSWVWIELPTPHRKLIDRKRTLLYRSSNLGTKLEFFRGS